MMNEKENEARYCLQYYTNDIDKLTDKEAESLKPIMIMWITELKKSYITILLNG